MSGQSVRVVLRYPIWSVLADAEDQVGECRQLVPEEEGDVVSDIKPMPERTHHKHQQLPLRHLLFINPILLLRAIPVVNTALQPELHTNIPIFNFIPHMNRFLNLQRIDCRNQTPIFVWFPISHDSPSITDPGSINSRAAQLPREVVFASAEGDTEPGVDEVEEEGTLSELVGVYVGEVEVWEVDGEVDAEVEDALFEGAPDYWQSVGNVFVLVCEVDVIVVLLVLQRGAHGCRRQKQQIPEILIQRGQLHHPIRPLLLI